MTRTSKPYGAYKRNTTAADNQPKRTLQQPISARELTRAQQSKADFQTHFADTHAKDLVKDLYNAGLIDGWRNVTVTIDKED